MLKRSEKTIDGAKYEVTAFGARQGYRLQARLASIIAPALKGIVASLKGGLDAEIDLAEAGAGAASLVAGLIGVDPDGKLIVEMFERTQRDGRVLTEAAIDDVYSANYGEMVKALAFVVEANDFFAIASSGRLTKLVGLAQSFRGDSAPK